MSGRISRRLSDIESAAQAWQDAECDFVGTELPAPMPLPAYAAEPMPIFDPTKLSGAELAEWDALLDKAARAESLSELAGWDLAVLKREGLTPTEAWRYSVLTGKGLRSGPDYSPKEPHDFRDATEAECVVRTIADITVDWPCRLSGYALLLWMPRPEGWSCDSSVLEWFQWDWDRVHADLLTGADGA